MNPILAGILQGAGFGGQALAQERQKQEDRALREKQLGLQERTVASQESANALQGELTRYKMGEEERSLKKGGLLADILEKTQGVPTEAPEIRPEGAMYSEQTPIVSKLPKEIQSVVQMYRTHGDKPDVTKAFMDYVFRKPEKPTLVSDTTTGYLDAGGKYTPLPGAGQAAEPPAERPGFKVKTHIDARGRKSYTEEQALPKPERTLSERYAEAALRFKENPNDPQARADYEKSKLAFANEEKLAGLRASGAADARPLPDVTAQAIATHDNILASAQLLKTFTPEEIQTYSGLINRPLQNVKLALQGIAPSQFGSPDARFADFKALMGRLQGTAFGEGGKQLTGIELAVVKNYTPTGSEPGGAAEIQAKIKNLEAFTRLARNSRLMLAQTGRADISPDLLDATIRQEMQRAGLPLPGQTATPPAAPAQPAAQGGTLSRQSQTYQRARAKGMSDAEIEAVAGAKLVP